MFFQIAVLLPSLIFASPLPADKAEPAAAIAIRDAQYYAGDCYVGIYSTSSKGSSSTSVVSSYCVYSSSSGTYAETDCYVTRTQDVNNYNAYQCSPGSTYSSNGKPVTLPPSGAASVSATTTSSSTSSHITTSIPSTISSSSTPASSTQSTSSTFPITTSSSSSTSSSTSSIKTSSASSSSSSSSRSTTSSTSRTSSSSTTSSTFSTSSSSSSGTLYSSSSSSIASSSVSSSISSTSSTSTTTSSPSLIKTSTSSSSSTTSSSVPTSVTSSSSAITSSSTSTTLSTSSAPSTSSSTKTSSPSTSPTTSTSSAISTPTTSSSTSTGSTSTKSSSSLSSSSASPSASCYADNIGSNGRTLSQASTSSGSMTNEMCQSYCSNLGFYYSGTEYSGECYCGNTTPTVLSTACTMSCNGNSAQVCGGPNALTVSYNSTLAAKMAAMMAGYSPFGCYSEHSPVRALSGASTSSSSMTVETCVRFCKSAGYAIAGVEYGSECYCDNSILSDGATLGVPSSGCSFTCGGNTAETCGGSSLLNIYSSQPSLAINIPSVSVTQFTAANANGQCASDWAPGNNNQRVLSGISTSSSSMTPTVCSAYCSAYKYYGIEYSSECYCGNTIASTSIVASNCTSTCSGDSSQVCGGGWAMNIWTSPTRIST